jgi:hypothetical protein
LRARDDVHIADTRVRRTSDTSGEVENPGAKRAPHFRVACGARRSDSRDPSPSARSRAGRGLPRRLCNVMTTMPPLVARADAHVCRARRASAFATARVRAFGSSSGLRMRCGTKVQGAGSV